MMRCFRPVASTSPTKAASSYAFTVGRSWISASPSTAFSSGIVGPHMLFAGRRHRDHRQPEHLRGFGQSDNVVLEFLNREIANAGEQADLVVDQKNRAFCRARRE